jgi:hypothetical protein
MRSHYSGTSNAFVRALATVIIAVTAGATRASAQVIHVDDTAAGVNDGSSWTDAYFSLDTAIANSVPGDTIWVARGIYKPASTTTGFYIGHSLSIYGGFNATETTFSQRANNFVATILDGDLGTIGNRADNAHHVISIVQVPSPSLGVPGVLIDGFLIRDGNGFSASPNKDGGGIWSTCSDVDVVNCFLRSNSGERGGGIYFAGGCYEDVEPEEPALSNIPNTLRVLNCEFQSNTGNSRGGGIYGEVLNGVVVNSEFEFNLSNLDGGAVYLQKMGSTNSLDFANCVFWANVSIFQSGAGVALGQSGSSSGDGGRAQIIACTFSGNSSDATAGGGALRVSALSNAFVSSSIMWFNTNNLTLPATPIDGTITLEYSNVEGWTAGGTGNINLDPKFNNAGMGQLWLQSISPSIDAADADATPLDIFDLDGDSTFAERLPIDIIGQNRYIDDINVGDSGGGFVGYMDMGAYERR